MRDMLHHWLTLLLLLPGLLESRCAAARTVQEAVGAYAPAAEARLQPHFAAAGVAYPPADVTLVVLKEEGQVELWARGAAHAPYKRVHVYPMTATSGKLGPKLREGDEQIPEGLYGIAYFNPNSQFHLSMKVDYPNAWDREQAAADKRTKLGGDIFVHGSALSIGCVAVGDPAIEELFVLAVKVGQRHVALVLAPRDLRLHAPPSGGPPWTAELYARLGAEMKRAYMP